jgi:hypothetical protein
VDDLAGDEDAPVRELLARLVRVFDRAVYAVAEAELLGEEERQLADLEAEALLAHPFDQRAGVVADELARRWPASGRSRG